MSHANRRKNERGAPPGRLAAAVLSGGAVSVAVTALLLLLAALALCSGRLEEGTAAGLCPGAAALGNLLGGFWAARTLGERFLPAALGAAGLGAAVWLLLGTLVLGGAAPAAALRLLLIALGVGALSGALCAR